MSIRHKLNLYRRYPYWRRENCIFIHIPKAAGTSVNHALYGRTLGHYSIAEITQRFPGLVNESFVFSFARNPYSRILSSYHFAKAGKTNDMGISRPEQYQTQEFASFDRFLNEWLVRQDLAEVDFVFQPQCNFVCIDGELALDFLGNVESLDEDIQLIEEKLGRSLVVGRKNVVAASKAHEWEKVLTSDMQDTITSLYWRDFELLGYKEYIS